MRSSGHSSAMAPKAPKAPNFFTGGNNSAVKYFQIRVEEDHLILRGTADEASSVVLKGTLILCTSEPLKAQGIHMSFKGQARTSFALQAASSTKLPKQEETFFVKRWEFDNQNENKKQHNILPAGNHEWPFELILDGNLPESIEGLPLSWIVYRLKATVDRGVFAKNLESHKHIRLIRTFDIGSLELTHNMNVVNTWPNKIQYDISTPMKSVVFGTSVRIDFKLIPLLKGLGIGTITSDLIETQEVRVKNREMNRVKNHERKVASDEYIIPEHVETVDIEGQDGYEFSRYIQVPKRMAQCVQSVNEKGIQVKHHLKFAVQLVNPDMHISELRATLPIQIFISPNLRLNDNNELTNAAATTQDLLEDMSLAPPTYEAHQLDPLYDGVDPRGFMTPGGASTPYNQSRRGSEEDVSIDALANSEVSANTLHNRLVNLNTTDDNSGRRSAISGPTPPQIPSNGPSRNSSFANGEFFAAAHGNSSRASSSNPVSRRSSAEDSPAGSGSQTPALRSGHHTPIHLEFNEDELTRVPSYNTAIHSNPRTPFSNDLPDYFSATSRPPSPPSAAGSRSATPGVEGPRLQNTASRHAHFTEDPPEQFSAERRPQHHNFLHPIRARH